MALWTKFSMSIICVSRCFTIIPVLSQAYIEQDVISTIVRTRNDGHYAVMVLFENNFWCEFLNTYRYIYIEQDIISTTVRTRSDEKKFGELVKLRLRVRIPSEAEFFEIFFSPFGVRTVTFVLITSYLFCSASPSIK